jgi:ankyrin repeat protein
VTNALFSNPAQVFTCKSIFQADNIVQYLIEKKAKTDTNDYVLYRNLLHVACVYNKEKVADILLKAETDENSCNFLLVNVTHHIKLGIKSHLGFHFDTNLIFVLLLVPQILAHFFCPSGKFFLEKMKNLC